MSERPVHHRAWPRRALAIVTTASLLATTGSFLAPRATAGGSPPAGTITTITSAEPTAMATGGPSNDTLYALGLAPAVNGVTQVSEYDLNNLSAAPTTESCADCSVFGHAALAADQAGNLYWFGNGGVWERTASTGLDTRLFSAPACQTTSPYCPTAFASSPYSSGGAISVLPDGSTAFFTDGDNVYEILGLNSTLPPTMNYLSGNNTSPVPNPAPTSSVGQSEGIYGATGIVGTTTDVFVALQGAKEIVDIDLAHSGIDGSGHFVSPEKVIAGNVTTVTADDNQPALNGIGYTLGLALDGAHQVYFGQYNQGKVLRISDGGNPSSDCPYDSTVSPSCTLGLVVGGGSSTAENVTATLESMSGGANMMAVGGDGALYVDSGSGIKRVQDIEGAPIDGSVPAAPGNVSATASGPGVDVPGTTSPLSDASVYVSWTPPASLTPNAYTVTLQPQPSGTPVTQIASAAGSCAGATISCAATVGSLTDGTPYAVSVQYQDGTVWSSAGLAGSPVTPAAVTSGSSGTGSGPSSVTVSVGAGGSGTTPASGSGAGGTLVSITGSGFTGASGLVFSTQGIQSPQAGLTTNGITDACASPLPAVSPGQSGCFAVLSDSLIEAFTPVSPTVGTFGVQVLGTSGAIPASLPKPLGANSFTYLATASNHLSPVFTWGDNRYDEQSLSSADSTYQPLPLAISALPGNLGISQVAVGAYHALALGSDGTVWSWGGNGQGQLGSGSLSNSPAPTQVVCPLGSNSPVLSDITQVAAGAYHSLALRNDGTVWAWGSDSDGQLGDGGTATVGGLPASPVPIEVEGPGGTGSLSGITQIAAGGWGDTSHDGFSLALKSDGTVLAWGQNNDGQLGNGTTTANATPLQVPGLSGVVAIAAGGLHALALKSDGTVWAWGDDERGQTTDASALLSAAASGGPAVDLAPVEVAGPGGSGSLGGVSHIAAGPFHSLALKTDGSVYAWGDDSQGQLGSAPDQADYSAAPQQVTFPNGTVVSGLAAGGSPLTPDTGFSAAVDRNGAVWTWGGNDLGQLGQGASDSNPHATPAELSGLQGVTAVTAGGENALAAYATASGVTGTGTGTGAGTGGTQTIGPPVVTSATSPGIYTDGTRRLDIKGSNLSTATEVVYGFPPGTNAPPACPGNDQPTTATCFYTVQPADFASGDLHPLAPPGADLTNVVVVNPAGASVGFAVSGISGTQPHIDHVVADASYSDGSHGLIVYGSGFTNVQYVLYGQVAPTEIAPICQMSGENLLPVQNGAPCVYQLRSIDLYSPSGTPDTEFEPMAPPGADLNHVTLLSALGHSNTAGILNPIGSAPSLSGISAAGTNPSDHRPLVTITGSGLAKVIYVDFGSVPSPSVTNQTDGSVTAEVPKGTGTVPLIATSFAGSNPTSGTGSLAFTYPVITGVSVVGTATDGNPQVAISGSGLTSGQPEVFFGSIRSPNVTVSGSQLDAEVPDLPPGTPSSLSWQYVVVRTPYGDTPDTGACPGAVDCAQLPPAPATVSSTSVSPNGSSASCPNDPGSCPPLFRVFGSGLGDVDQVDFGNAAQNQVFTFAGTNYYGSQIAAYIPVGSGTVPVSVVDGQTGKTISAGTYTYPDVTSVTSTGSSGAGGSPIVDVNGVGLTLGTAIPEVYFGAYASPSVTLGQNGSLVVTVPSLTAGDSGGWEYVTVRSENGDTQPSGDCTQGAPDCFNYPPAGAQGSWASEYGPSSQPPSAPAYGQSSAAAPLSGAGPSFGNITTQGSWSTVSSGVYAATVTATRAVQLNGLRISGQGQGQATLTLDTNQRTLTASGTVMVSLAAVTVPGVGTVGPFTIYQGTLSQTWHLDGTIGIDLSNANIGGIGLGSFGSLSFVNGGAELSANVSIPDILGGGGLSAQFATTTNGVDPNSLHVSLSDTGLGQLIGLHGMSLYFDPASGGWDVTGASVADMPGNVSGGFMYANGAIRSGHLTVVAPTVGGLVGLDAVSVSFTSGGAGNEQWSGNATAADGSAVSAYFDYSGGQLSAAGVSVPHASLAGGMFEIDGLQASYAGGGWSLSTSGAQLAGVVQLSGSLSVSSGVITSGNLTVSSASIGGLVDLPSFTLSYDGSTPGAEDWTTSWTSAGGQTNQVKFDYAGGTLVSGDFSIYGASVAGLFTLPAIGLSYAQNGVVEQWSGSATWNGQQASFAFGWSAGTLTSSSVYLPATSLAGVLPVPALSFSSQGGLNPSWSLSANGGSSLSGSLSVVGGHVISGSLSLSGFSFGGLVNLPSMTFSYQNTGAAQTWAAQVGNDSGSVSFQNGALVSGSLNVSQLSLAGLISIDQLSVSSAGGTWNGQFSVAMAGGSDVALAVTVGVDQTGTLQTFTLSGDAELSGFLDLKGLNVTYDPGSATYSGGVQNVDLPGLGLGAGATVEFVNGALTKFDINVQLPTPGIALGTSGIFLDGGDLNLQSTDPLTFGGSLVLSAGPEVIGNTAALFGTLGVTFSSTGFDAQGSLSVIQPDFTLGDADVSLNWGGPNPGVTVSGTLGFNFQIPGLSANVSAGVKGWLHSDAFGIGAHADIGVTASLWGWSWTGNFQMAVAATNLGVGACASANNFGVGFSYNWSGSFHAITSTCDLGRIGFSFNARRARVAGAAHGHYAPRVVTTYQTTLPAGLPGEAFVIQGTGAVPSVTLTDPNGSPTDVPASTPSGTFLDSGKFLVVENGAADTLYVIAYAPAAGQWTVTPDQGSAPISSVGNANGLNKDVINASVNPGQRGQQVLSWAALLNPGDQVRFNEVDSAGAQVLTTTSDASGSFTFTPTDGPGGTRQITADIIRNGMVADTQTVAIYTAPDPTAPPAPSPVTAGASGGSAQVTWTAPLSDGGSPIERYLIEPSDGGPGTFEPAGTLSASLAMKPGETEHFIVVAVNAIGAGTAAASPDVTNLALSGGTPPGLITVPAGGTVSSAPGGPSSGSPLVATLTTPVGGQVDFTVITPTSVPSGYRLIPVGVQISAPAGSAAQPLDLRFALDPSVLPAGTDVSELTVFRDGVPLGRCTGAGATPDPCVAFIQQPGSSIVIDVLTDHASTWTFAMARVSRMAGTDRVGTAVAISHYAFHDGAAGGAVLATANDFPDALAGGPLAVKVNGPVLLTAPSTLDSAVATELRRAVRAGSTVYVLGGTSALSDAVVEQVQGLGFHPLRVAGADRYGTAVAVAEALGNPGDVFLTTGTDFADALAAGDAAAAGGGAVLLTAGSTIPSATRAYLRAHQPTRLNAVGGPAAQAAGRYATTASAGADRYATALAVAQRFFPNATGAGLASGLNYPDALVAGPFLAALGEPLLLSDPRTLPPPVSAYLTAPSITAVHLFGGPEALTVSP